MAQKISQPKKLLNVRTSTTNPVREDWMHFTSGPSKPVIPFGLLFQANVPRWTGPIHSYDSKWLGTKIWPTNNASGTTVAEDETVIGKGRPDSCSCSSPGSVVCVKLHVSNKIIQLRLDIGDAFEKWKFHEMGNAVADLWNSHERNIFHSLVRKSNVASQKESFPNLVLKRLPSKCRESVVSYYFNVYVPRQLSMQIRARAQEVDTNEEVEGEVTSKAKRSRHQKLTYRTCANTRSSNRQR